MANCPKCGNHLGIFDWKQHCKKCGANIFVYGLQERLMQDADKAEVECYHFQKRIDRLKASFVGSKMAIARIITSILPAGALFLPLAKLKVTGVLEPFDGNFSAITLINKADKLGDLPKLLSEGGVLPLVALALLVLSAVLTVTHLVLLTLACSPKGKGRNLGQIIAILAFTVASIILTFCCSSGPVTAVPSIGAYLYLLLQLLNGSVDYLCCKQGVPVHHKQCYCGGIPIEEYFQMVEDGIPQEEIRQEQYRRLQAIQDEKVAEMKKKEEEEAKANG